MSLHSPVNNFKTNNINFKLSWKNLSIWLKKSSNKSFWTLCQQDEYIKILNNVSGVSYSGTLTAVMGSSGSGKTTLLTTISQRINGVVVGDLFLNNKPISRCQMKKISGFLPQQELPSGYLTVIELMQFMARLKMDETTTIQTRNQNIFMILNRLGLHDRAGTKLPFLSGGELKKLSLAEQLITDPPFLFCDEPTTGLDSYNAINVVKILHDIANYGKAVICSIHQPTYEIFEFFDQVAILVKGSVIYHGPTDKFERYFNNLGIICPDGYNLVEFYISHFARNQNNAIFVQNMCDEFEKSDVFKDLYKHNYHTDNIVSNGSLSHNYSYNLPKSKQKMKFCTQLHWLLWRCAINMKRNNKNILLRFLLYMFIAILLSTMYWNITEEFNQKDIQNLQGLIFLVVTETIFTFTYSVLHTFPDEMPKLLREISDGVFDPEPYYVSKIVSMLPVIIVETISYSVLIFWCVGLTGGFTGYFYFYLPILCCALSSSAYGFALSTSFESVSTATLGSVPIEFLGMTYSGIYINIKNLSWISFWCPYISQFYYGTEAASIKQWENISDLRCENPDLPCLQTGKMVLNKYGYHENRYLVDLLALLLYCFICHCIAFLSFKRKCKKEASY